MMTATQCPTSDQLRLYSLGRLPEGESDALFEHLQGCDACQSELETVDDVEDSLIGHLRSEGDDPFGDEPDCSLAVAKALGALATASEEFSIPKVIGEYEVLRPLGRGGMGEVHLARHTKLGRQVALKVLAGNRLADARSRERFEAEMRAIGRLSHPNIVIAHDAREVDGTAVLVTEYIDGLDLGEIVRRTGPLSVADACELTRKVAAALQYTSEQGFVHRDVKPSNIMIAREGAVKLLDLGLARLSLAQPAADELTGTGQAIGTADYVAPEQVTDGRSVDSRADIYSLGCTLFKLLTGRAPFADEEYSSAYAKMNAHVSVTPPSLGDFDVEIPQPLVRLVDSMLAKDPGKRPQSPRDVAEVLGRYVSGQDLSTLLEKAQRDGALTQTLVHSTTTPKATLPWFRRPVPFRTAVGAGLFGLMLGLLGGWFIRITFEDKTEVTIPVTGAKVEMFSKDDDAGGNPNAAAQVDPAEATALGGSGLPAEPVATIPNVPAIPRPDGIWQVTGVTVQGGGEEVDAWVGDTVMGIINTEVYLVTFVEPNQPRFRFGRLDSIGRLLWAPESNAGGEARVSFSSDKLMLTLLSAKRRRPFLNQQFTRVGDFPVTADQARAYSTLPDFDPKTPLFRGLAAIQQMRAMGPGQFQQASQSMQDEAGMARTANRLRKILIGMHNFHDAYRQIPGSVNTTRAGSQGVNSPDDIKPFSWRVALLPFVGENELFEAYRFDEPWDSPANLSLVERIPEVYQSPRAAADQPKGHTNYLGYATGNSGLGTAEEELRFRDFLDGTSNTVMVAEVKKSVPWTKPEDLSGIDDTEYFNPLIYVMADGAVNRTEGMDRDRLKKMITRDGKEILPPIVK